MQQSAWLGSIKFGFVCLIVIGLVCLFHRKTNKFNNGQEKKIKKNTHTFRVFRVAA